MERTENIVEISKALVQAQAKIVSAIKDAQNPYFKSNYADLTAVIDAVKKPLNESGISFLQLVNVDGDSKPYVETVLLHESGQHILSKTPIFCGKPNDPQAFGSGVTYSKRYALQAMLGLPTEDDDGNAAAKQADHKNTAPELTKEEMAVLDEVYKRLFDVAREHNLIPDKPSIKIYALTQTKAKRLPINAEETARFVDGIVGNNGNNKLGQVCKPAPKGN